MSVTPYVFDGGLLSGAAATQGNAVPALTRRIIKSAALVNTTGGALAASVYLVPNGGSAAASNTLISARSIAPGESYPCPELINQGVNAGGLVQALGNGLTFKYTAVDIV